MYRLLTGAGWVAVGEAGCRRTFEMFTICLDIGTNVRLGMEAALAKRWIRLGLEGPAPGVGVGGDGSCGGGGVTILVKRPLESLLCWDACIRGVAKGNQKQTREIEN
jgi:hypothetical protein